MKSLQAAFAMIRRSRAALLVTLLFGLGAGSGCHQLARPATSSYGNPQSSADSAAGSAASAPGAVAESAAERPGLGTVWGESHYSPVRDVPFSRRGGGPAWMSSLLYNDAEGVAALRRRMGRRYQPEEPLLQAFDSGRSFVAASGGFGGIVIRVLDADGRPLPAYHLDDRVLLVGEAGQRYAIEISNHTDQRFEVVASVDGLDVVDGRAADPSKPGYLVTANSRLLIDGFRRTQSEVAAFRLGSVRDSYAARSADFGDRHVGVIGLALFAESGAPVLGAYEDRERRRHVDEDAALRDSADPFPGRYAQPPL